MMVVDGISYMMLTSLSAEQTWTPSTSWRPLLLVGAATALALLASSSTRLIPQSFSSWTISSAWVSSAAGSGLKIMHFSPHQKLFSVCHSFFFPNIQCAAVIRGTSYQDIPVPAFAFPRPLWTPSAASYKNSRHNPGLAWVASGGRSRPERCNRGTDSPLQIARGAWKSYVKNLISILYRDPQINRP